VSIFFRVSLMSSSDCLARGREFGVVWQLDSEVSQCPSCHVAFSLMCRKHHCRHCGKIHCATCTEYDLEHAITKRMERACKKCLDRTGGGAPPTRAAPSPAPASSTSSSGEGAMYGVPWKPDAEAHLCGCCRIPFTATNRKHHCRFCGDVVCLKCSVNQMVHPRTHRPEKACVTCVKRHQITEAVEGWWRSPVAIARAAAGGLCILVAIVALPVGAAGSAFAAVLSAPIFLGVLYAKWRQVGSGLSSEEFIAQYYNDAGHVYLVVLVLDTAATILALAVALSALLRHPIVGVFALLQALAAGSCVVLSYREATPALRLLWGQLRNTDDDGEGEEAA
jgi:hypothetical protein